MRATPLLALTIALGCSGSSARELGDRECVRSGDPCPISCHAYPGAMLDPARHCTAQTTALCLKSEGLNTFMAFCCVRLRDGARFTISGFNCEDEPAIVGWRACTAAEGEEATRLDPCP